LVKRDYILVTDTSTPVIESRLFPNNYPPVTICHEQGVHFSTLQSTTEKLVVGFPVDAPLMKYLTNPEITLQFLKELTSYNPQLRYPYPEFSGIIPHRFNDTNYTSTFISQKCSSKSTTNKIGNSLAPIKKKVSFRQLPLVFTKAMTKAKVNVTDEEYGCRVGITFSPFFLLFYKLRINENINHPLETSDTLNKVIQTLKNTSSKEGDFMTAEEYIQIDGDSITSKLITLEEIANIVRKKERRKRRNHRKKTHILDKEEDKSEDTSSEVSETTRNEEETEELEKVKRKRNFL
jgi:hypothetical protein